MVCRRFGTLYQFHLQRPCLLYLPPPHLLTHSEPPTTWCPLPIGPASSSKPRPWYKYHVLISLYFILHIQPLKMEQIECSETSANHNQTPGKYPKEYIQNLLFLHLVGCLYFCINDARSHKHQIYYDLIFHVSVKFCKHAISIIFWIVYWPRSSCELWPALDFCGLPTHSTPMPSTCSSGFWFLNFDWVPV